MDGHAFPPGMWRVMGADKRQLDFSGEDLSATDYGLFCIHRVWGPLKQRVTFLPWHMIRRIYKVGEEGDAPILTPPPILTSENQQESSTTPGA